MSASVQDYLGLVTSEHNQQPNFTGTVAIGVQPFCDMQGLLSKIPLAYDLDVAGGAQLDVVGQWVGISRYLTEPLPPTYFTLDQAGLGLDQGIWYEPYNPTTEIVRLPNDAYRTLLRAKILANNWNGTKPGAYAAFNALFRGTDARVLIQDNQDMTMTLALVGNLADATVLALFTGGYLDLKPMGVAIGAYVVATEADRPLFGFDINNAVIGGLDTGCWGSATYPTTRAA